MTMPRAPPVTACIGDTSGHHRSDQWQVMSAVLAEDVWHHGKHTVDVLRNTDDVHHGMLPDAT